MKRILTESTEIEQLKIWTVSNMLSLLRVLLLPFIYYFLKQGGSTNNVIALVLMFVGVVSDILDGLVARKMGAESSFGKILDPLADKICIGTMILILLFLRDFPAWLVGIVIFRDLLIVTSGAILIRGRNIVLSSNWLGKVTTIFMAMMIVAYTVEFHWTYNYLITGALIFLIASTVSYGITMYYHLYYRESEKTTLH
jgi:CDP-diacylglycerol--glycerol-3-phosphate 3-phosphatidyltransferase